MTSETTLSACNFVVGWGRGGIWQHAWL